MIDDDVRAAANTLTDQKERVAYNPTGPRNSKNRSSRLSLFLLISLPILVVIICVLWFVLIREEKITPISTQTNDKTSTVKPAQTNTDVADAEATETYQSSALSVAFKYPSTWKVSEANGGIRIETATFTFPSKYQGEVSGNFRIYIRQGARKVDGTYIGRGYAVKPSEKLTYTQPAVGQRTETLLSSFGYDTVDNFAYFLIAGNFQLAAGDTLGPNYGTEADTYIITGGYTSPTAVDDLATIPVAISYYQTTKAYNQALAILGSLQLK